MIDTEVVGKFRETLMQTQRMPRDALAEYQAGLLQNLLTHARLHVPWYSSLPEDAAKLEGWAGLPLLTREQAQASKRELTARVIPPFSGSVESSFTTGTTGRAMTFLRESLLESASAAQTERLFEWWRVDGDRKLATFMSAYFGIDNLGGGQRRGWRIGNPRGRRVALELMIDIDRQVDWLDSVQAHYVFVRGGAHLAALAERALDRGVRLRPQRILSTGAPMSAAARTAAKRAFKCEVVDSYGASEIGLIAYQCPECGFYHGCDETVRLEVLRENGTACGEGETGRVVATPLYAYAMPFIRYELGDYAKRGPDEAPCGRGLSSISAISGRYRNVFRLADGTLIHPYLSYRLSEVFKFRQAQIVQTAFDMVEIRYVPVAEDAPEPELEAVREFVRTAFHPTLDARLLRMDRIDSGPHGKFEETLSLV